MIFDTNRFLKKYQEMIMYIIFGVLTTLVNAFTYYICSFILKYSTATGTILAWITAVLFAYITNKIWVFKSTSWKAGIVFKEAISFFSCRAATGFGDLIIMVCLVDYMHINGLIAKILANIFVVITNYLASKLYIFNR